MEKYFRPLLVLQVTLQMAWFFIPWNFAYGERAGMALSWVGSNSILSETVIIYISNILTALYLIIYIGLFFYQNWARVLLLVISLLGGLCISLYGISVLSSYEGMLGYFITLIDGFLIATAYLTSISSKFKGEGLGK